MIITATDFQLRVNEYFTKMMQGEEIVIERYGKKFAVLVPFEKFEQLQKLELAEEKTSQTKINQESADQTNVLTQTLTPAKMEKMQQDSEQASVVEPNNKDNTNGVGSDEEGLSSAEVVRLLKKLLD